MKRIILLAALCAGCSKLTEPTGDLPTVNANLGTVVKAGDEVEVHYTGTLTDGTKFDSSRDRNETFKFVLGAGQVIKGWDEGVAGMKVGEKKKLTVPPNLGYGAREMGKIPANSTLLFDIEVIGVKPANAAPKPAAPTH